MEIEIQDIITEFGNYYKPGGQSIKDVRTALMAPSETELFFGTPRLTTATRIELSNAAISRVLQGYQVDFTEIGQTEFTPQIINLDHFKIDVKIAPAELMESWLGFLAENALQPKDCPLIKYWLEMLVIPKSKEDLEIYEIFAGKKVAPTKGTASAAGSNMNGIKEKLKAADISVITMGAVPTEPVEFVDYVEDFAGNIPEVARNATKNIAMNKTLELRYKQGKRKKYNQYYAQDADLLKLADFDINVKGLTSHASSTVIWATPDNNKVIGNKNPGNQTVFNIQEFDRQVKALTDFHKGVGFWSNKAVFRSDIALS